jgi:beta-lactamase superfamily II metal-dependent hydrolase
MPTELYIRIWDVQHGSAVYVRTPEGRHLAIDLGVGDTSGNLSTDKDYFSPLEYIRRAWGVRQLDTVVISHPHTDHVDDIFEFDKLNPLVLITPRHISDDDIVTYNRSSDKSVLHEYLKIRRRYSAPITGTSVYDEKPEFDFICYTPVTCNAANLNNQSIVVFMTYAGSTICIPGDPESCAWKEMLSQPGFKDYLRQTNILVASHHGRESGYYEEVFDYCTPQLVVISDGPQGATCVADKYRNKASGWEVHSFSKASKTRYVLTTRSDGSIDIRFGFEDDGVRYRAVTTE